METRTRGRRPNGVLGGREALLKAALICFAKSGYEGTSLRQLAAKASVDMALVARLFGSKAQLWVALVEHLKEVQETHLAKIRIFANGASSDPTGSFVQLVNEVAELGLVLPEFPALLMHEGALKGARHDLLVDRLVRPLRDASRPILQAAIDAKIIMSVSPDLCFGLLISAVAVPIMSPQLFGHTDLSSEQLSKTLAAEMLRLMLRSSLAPGCAAPAPGQS